MTVRTRNLCSFVFYDSDRLDALHARIAAALETEELDFEGLTIERMETDDSQLGPPVMGDTADESRRRAAYGR